MTWETETYMPNRPRGDWACIWAIRWARFYHFDDGGSHRFGFDGQHLRLDGGLIREFAEHARGCSLVGAGEPLVAYADVGTGELEWLPFRADGASG